MKLSKNFWKGAMKTREQRKQENVNMERDDKMLGSTVVLYYLCGLWKIPGSILSTRRRKKKIVRATKLRTDKDVNCPVQDKR